jgi:predicted RNA-binding Zn-ribbon protein involved in translation (DUF1610 family)
MKLSKMTWFNATIAALCLFSGIYALCQGNISMGILNIILAVLNLYCVLSYIAAWWKRSPKVSDKFVFTCRSCEHQFIPTFWTWFFVPHIGSKRYLKCEKCDKHTWMRRK